MSASFKPARTSDLETILAMMRDFYELEHIEFAERAARAALAQILSDESLGRVWLIESGPEAVGYLVLTFGFSLEFKGRDAFVDELYLRAEFRGRGLGRRALGVAEAACRESGGRALHLEVERANAAAHELYRRFGFRAHDRHLMTKWIEEQG
ncbi:MAG: GNAT family N-acetyltransferase [Acidobacteria bacterium]|nr:GNAT family N-acetyltransferase [Acidobacteriota bacterium]